MFKSLPVNLSTNCSAWTDLCNLLDYYTVWVAKPSLCVQFLWRKLWFYKHISVWVCFYECISVSVCICVFSVSVCICVSVSVCFWVCQCECVYLCVSAAESSIITSLNYIRRYASLKKSKTFFLNHSFSKSIDNLSCPSVGALLS